MWKLRATLWLVLLFAAIAPAEAQSVLQKLISPGPLSFKHANLESKCEACHASFNQSVQPQLCKTCHKPVAADIAAKTGFHGKFHPASADCRTCHTEHAGHDAKIVKLDRTTFNHDFTDYPLQGRHVGVPCASCHLADRKFRDAPSQCAACHRKDDVHKGSLGQDCASCHTEKDWKNAKFDHNTTKFPLVGAHARAQCQACHADRHFADTPTECVSCHRKDDVHKGSQGPQCASCHDVNDWKATHFDHDRTGFPLTGKHAATQCNACHVEPADKVKLPTTCNACHRKDDVHKGSNGPECAQCHTTATWKGSTFDHASSGFPLRGKHAQIACTACHTAPPREKKLSVDCFACHAKDDKHAGQLGQRCEQCHNEGDWKTAVRFDHDFAPFPLIGKHASVACKDCHATPRFKDASANCIECHRKDDKHHGSLGAECASCHNPSDWANWTFDHTTQTQFPLTGAHVNLTCATCHHGTLGKVSAICADCHAVDDVHQGAFGRSCERCHGTDSFRAIRQKF